MAGKVEPGRRPRRRRRRNRQLALLALALAILLAGGVLGAGAWLLGGVGAHHDRGGHISAKAKGTTTTSAAPSTTTSRGPEGSGQSVTFAFGGDVNFEASLRSKLDANPEGVLAPIAPVLSSADVAAVNLETAITDRGTPESKQYVFCAPATALTALQSAGVDTATVANNHGLDYGLEGLEDTLAAKQSTGFDLIGVGHNATEAYAPHRMEVNGQRIAIVAATQVLDSQFTASWSATDTQPGLASAKDAPRLIAAVQAARGDSDTVVVFLHWGVEGESCPSSDQTTMAEQLADAGADIVVGSHTHRQQAGGRLGNAFVDYGLGNFVFYNENGAAGVTGVLQVTATGRRIDSYQWTPARIRGGVPQPLEGPPADEAIATWNGLRGCSDLAA